MKKIGKILFAKENKAIVKLNKPVKLGLKVYLKNRVIGRVVDIFGPVDAPYAEIKLNNKFRLRKNDEGKEIYA